jgi:hypothetical protein
MKKHLTWTTVLIVLGVGAAITVLMPSIATIAAITIIGLPIAIYLMLAPLLFLLALGTFVIGRKLGGSMFAYVAGIAASVFILALPPFFANRALENEAQLLIAGDLDDATKPSSGIVVGLRYADAQHFPKDALSCDGLCQRLLLNGVASQVLVISQDIGRVPDRDQILDAFRMDKRNSCPAVKLARGYDPIEIAHELRDWQKKKIDELMQIAIANGNCLISEKVALGQADYVVSFGRFRRGKSQMEAGFSLLADTIRAVRISLHERKGATYAETYRWTGVIMEKLFPLYAPTALMGAELRTESGLGRYTAHRNIDKKFYDRPDITAFLTKRLGLDLALRADTAKEDTQVLLKEALLDKTATTVPSQVAADFFQGLMRAEKLTADDQALARAVLEDQRFPVPAEAWAAIHYAKSASPDYFTSIAAAMVDRLRAIDRKDAGEEYAPWRAEASAIGDVFRELPRDAILEHKDDLEWLARRERLRVEAYQALIRLSEFGAEGGATLLWLIDDSERFRAKAGNPWQHPHLAGLIGFCKMGLAGKDYVQPLFDRLDKGTIANWASYHRLVVNVLVGMGADAEDIWRHAKPKDDKSEKDMRADFDHLVERAHKSRDCSY